MPYVSHFRELHVWRRGMELVEAVYRVSAAFPKAELYGLTGQIRRAAVSIPSNIAEGHTRASTKEYLNHLSIAQASLAELETQLEIAIRLKFVEEPESQTILDQAVILGRQLWALRIAVGKRK
jgi:four helix bundle protein